MPRPRGQAASRDVTHGQGEQITMSTNVNLPALGESVTEGTVTRWLKKVGDTVAVDEPIVEVSTDKVDTEIPSPVAGVIEEIFVQEDQTIEVGAPLARIGEGGGAAPAAPAAPVAEAAVVEPPVAEAAQPVAPTPATPAPVAEPVVHAEPVVATPVAPEPLVAAPPVVAAAPVAEPVATVAAPVVPATPRFGSPYVSPIVRKLAHDRGVDLNGIVGTGIGGRIRKEDVLSAANAAEVATPVVVASAPVSAPTVATVLPAASSPSGAPSAPVSALRGTRVPMSRLRKVIAERAVQSMVSTAQLTTVVEVDVTAVSQLRDSIKADFLAATGHKLTFLPFFVKAAVEALQAYPIINSTVQGDDIVYPSFENVSIAVDTERGLLTPVVQNAGGKSIATLSGEIADLAARTRDNKLTPDELQGGTFTVTNTGSRGALFDTPVVFLPQSAILGLGLVVKRPVVLAGDSIAIRSMVYLALSYDHRIVDGADAARFLGVMKSRLEAGAFSAADLGY
ncbi:MAG: 2-oxoglutarate dehydrogenase, E2 component, dihydrolipoamide succinyltransferase [Microbacteriaceae bacterium]|nr:2-oxoglutarate dehydrogenase, E2 component, dihydrolipoamide succinyltransferase [Microbacteriaceae bacterium]